MKKVNRLEEEFLKLEKEGIDKYKLPKDLNEWPQRDKVVFISVLDALKIKEMNFKRDFLRIHRRRVAILAIVVFIGLSFINPFLGLAISFGVIGAGFLFDRLVQMVDI